MTCIVARRIALVAGPVEFLPALHETVGSQAGIGAQLVAEVGDRSRKSDLGHDRAHFAFDRAAVLVLVLTYVRRVGAKELL